MNVSVIIVSYNTAHLISDCIASVQSVVGIEKEIIIVDNASIDGSIEIIKQRFPSVTLISNKYNRGFGAANNQALPYCQGKYIVYLNPDTTIAADTLHRSVLYMDTNQHVGLAGAKILNTDGSLQPSVSHRYPGQKYAKNETAILTGEIACVMGAFMIARKSLLIDLLGFDEDFFLYGEDQDLCWRIRERGYSIGYIEDAEVLHWGGQSEIKTLPAVLFEKKLKAEYLFYQKHYTFKTITRIKKTEKFKAFYRLITLKLIMPFCRNKIQLQNKIDRYRLIYYMTKY
jgi:N-acetylglucosaminyl-diphospho-decaprenol L-rhamnosyltransferase